MISIYKFAITEKPNMERESRVYNYFETYMDNLEHLGTTKSEAAFDGIIGKFVLDFEPLQNDDIIGIAIMDEENLIDFLYETESGTLRWSTDHFDAQDYLAKVME